MADQRYRHGLCLLLSITSTSAALRQASAQPTEAIAYFTARLTFHADVSDVHGAMESGAPGFALVDSRGPESWAQGRIPGALHLPTSDIPRRSEAALDRSVPVITYCWGPACDGGTRAALALAELGYLVKEMIGGIEYWIREGFPIETDSGVVWRDPDPLTGHIGVISCEC